MQAWQQLHLNPGGILELEWPSRIIRVGCRWPSISIITLALITHWLCVASGRASAVKQPLKVLTIQGCLLAAVQQVVQKVLHWKRFWVSPLKGPLHNVCLIYLLISFFVNNSFNSPFLSLATEGILTDIIRKHFLKFRTVHIGKGLPWEVMSSLSPAVVRQSLADDFGRKASCTGR